VADEERRRLRLTKAGFAALVAVIALAGNGVQLV
jgi:hypothetical protein